MKKTFFSILLGLNYVSLCMENNNNLSSKDASIILAMLNQTADQQALPKDDLLILSTLIEMEEKAVDFNNNKKPLISQKFRSNKKYSRITEPEPILPGSDGEILWPWERRVKIGMMGLTLAPETPFLLCKWNNTCRYLSNATGPMKTHLRTHIGFYTCPQCKEVFFRKDLFNQHSYSHKLFLTAHFKNIHNYSTINECYECKLKFYTSNEYEAHVNIIHSQRKQPSFVCQWENNCLKKFSTAKKLWNHVCVHVFGFHKK